MKKTAASLCVLLLGSGLVSALDTASARTQREFDLFMAAWHRAAAKAEEGSILLPR